jgi:antitoxin component of RelBE/YafQ-DinJ toxin-antitoxin module
MTTISVTVDDQLAERAQQAAAERNTTLDDLVQQYLKQLASATQGASDVAADRLLQTFRDLSRPLGGKPYQQRDELYDR